jgi:hypothetical protein
MADGKMELPPVEADWTELAQMDPNIRMMQQAGVPMTRENYIDTATNGQPEAWTEEDEMGLPPQLQGFQGVGLSELPQGPMPIPEGPMGGGIKPKMGEAQEPPKLVQQKAETMGPARPANALGARFTGKAGWNPNQGG